MKIAILKGFQGRLGRRLGCVLGRPGGVLGGFGASLGGCWGVLGRLGGVIGLSWRLLGRLGPSWGRLRLDFLAKLRHSILDGIF